MPHHTHTPQQHNTALHSTATQHSNTAQLPFTRVCLEFLTTLTCRALYGKSHCHGQSCRFLALVFNHFDFQNTARESQCVSTILSPSKKKQKILFFSIFFVSPGHLRTIQNLIPGWTTIVKLLKQVKNWQSPSRDPWSNCLINSREDDKGQSYYYSGRQKDNSKTICRCGGYCDILPSVVTSRCSFWKVKLTRKRVSQSPLQWPSGPFIVSLDMSSVMSCVFQSRCYPLAPVVLIIHVVQVLRATHIWALCSRAACIRRPSHFLNMGPGRPLLSMHRPTCCTVSVIPRKSL